MDMNRKRSYERSTTTNHNSNVDHIVRQVAASIGTSTDVHNLQNTAIDGNNTTIDQYHQQHTTSSSSMNHEQQQEHNNIYQYQRLPIYGEHKRAISTVKIAPNQLCYNHNHHNNYQFNSNSNNNEQSIYETVIASASADGICKLWNISLPYFFPPNTDTDDYTKLIRGTMKYTSSSSSTTLSSSSTTTNTNHNHNTDIVLQPYMILSGSHTRGINDISWNRSLPYIATASDDKTIKLWDCITSSSSSSNSTTSGSPSMTSHTHHSHSQQSSYTKMNHEPLLDLHGHDHFVFCVDQYTNMIVSGSFDETVKLWDIRTGDCISTLPAHSDPVTAVAFNRDGTIIVSGSHDGLIRFWDVMTGECLKTIYATGNPPVSSVSFAPNSKYILAGTLDSTLRLWPITTTTSIGTNNNNGCTKMYRYNNNNNNSNNNFMNTKYSIASTFTYNGNILVGNENGYPVLFDLQSTNVIQILKPSTIQQQQQQTKQQQSTTTNNNNNNNNMHQSMNDNPYITSDTHHTDEQENESTINKLQNNMNDNDIQQQQQQQQYESTNNNSNTTTNNNTTNTNNNAILAVSAHDTQPFICTGSMGTKRVEFWCIQPMYKSSNDDNNKDDPNQQQQQFIIGVDTNTTTSTTTTTNTTKSQSTKKSSHNKDHTGTMEIDHPHHKQQLSKRNNKNIKGNKKESKNRRTT